jgi:hypothetical protein
VDNREQEILDIMMACVMMIHDPRNYFEGQSNEEVATWVRKQLDGCGIKTRTMGSSWAVLYG